MAAPGPSQLPGTAAAAIAAVGGGGSADAPNVLKRGSACLCCRKRKLKCDAVHPTCKHCAKSGTTCVYDEPRRKGRVAQLEDRILELQKALEQARLNKAAQQAAAQQAAQQQQQPGGGALGVGEGTRTQGALGAFGPAAVAGLDMAPLPVNPLANLPPLPPLPGGPSSAFPAAPAAAAYRPLPFAFSSTGSGASSSDSPPFGTSSSSIFDVSPSQQPGTFSHTSSFSGPSSSPFPDAFPPPPAISTPYLPGPEPAMSYPPAITIIDNLLPPASGPPLDPQPILDQLLAQAGQAVPDFSGGGSALPPDFEVLMGEGTDFGMDIAGAMGFDHLVGNPGAYDMSIKTDLFGDDVPPDVAQHLFDLFFERFSLSAILHAPTFYASLHAPLSSTERPHPCLLFAIYTSVARLSPDHTVALLAEHFLIRARAHLSEAIAKVDRVLHALQACLILSVNAYGQAQISSAWTFSGIGTKLALSLGLHRLTAIKLIAAARRGEGASVSFADGVEKPGTKVTLLRTPSDPLQQAQAVLAFWGLFVSDRAGSIACTWPLGFDEKEISTVFWPPGRMFGPDNIPISPPSLLDPDVYTSHPVDCANVYMIKAMSLASRASRLNDSLPRPKSSAPHAGGSQSPPPTPPPLPLVDEEAEEDDRLRRIKESPEFEKLDKMIAGFLMSLPGYMREPPRPDERGSFENSAKITAMSVAHLSQLLLHVPHAKHDPLSARICATAAHGIIAIVAQLSSPSFDLGRLNVFIVVCWLWAGITTVHQLRWIKRQAEGQARPQHERDALWARIAVLRAEVGLVHSALKRFGETWPLGELQAALLEKALAATFAGEGLVAGWDRVW